MVRGWAGWQGPWPLCCTFGGQAALSSGTGDGASCCPALLHCGHSAFSEWTGCLGLVRLPGHADIKFMAEPLTPLPRGESWAPAPAGTWPPVPRGSLPSAPTSECALSRLRGSQSPWDGGRPRGSPCLLCASRGARPGESGCSPGLVRAMPPHAPPRGTQCVGTRTGRQDRWGTPRAPSGDSVRAPGTGQAGGAAPGPG